MRLASSALALLLTSCALAAEPALRFSIAQSWTMPLVQVDDGQAHGGILYDLMSSLARQVGVPAEFYVIPRKRLQAAMENGQIDVRCYAAQSWLPNLSGDYIWSIPVMQQRDILVAQVGDDAPVDISRLKDEKIGTVLGFIYPILQPGFDKGLLQRDDARNQYQVLEKLLAHRYRYAASNELTVNWLNHQLPPAQQLHEVAEIQDLQLGCYVRNDPAVPVQRVLRTLLRMKMSGEVDDLVRHYNGLPVGQSR
ncbi:transporter substrate-binding domain-containing protein [Pseudomonas sp. HR96]|uniref:substrate-binding periplasmic protein n=1 Tax=Pseudomonas sp. HR96 TaxID=1027966 RepID=UPI002A74977F|nr:transporter substrate-binding domain-containing protein [Pseudomonas sp. HR96]WPP01424.1 transporter substrate-binding domain-containing protein [Pseudomonas sp. HR96]